MIKRGAIEVILLLGFWQAAFGQTQLIQNGSFESTSFEPWVLSGPGVTVINGPGAPDGTQYLSMGFALGAVQTVYQIVTFPTNLIAATLNLDYDVISTDTAGSDTLTVYLTDTNTPPNILATLGQASNLNPTGGWVPSSDNFATYGGNGAPSPWAGKTAEVYFYVTTDPTYGNLTTFNIDAVSLLAFTTAAIPANDNFSNAIPILTAGITNEINTAYASKETGEPKHAGNAGGHSVWWTWTAPAIGTVSINTAGSSFITLLGVYTGSSVSNLMVVTNNNGNARASGLASAQFNVTPGTTYQIALDGYNGQSGNAVLNFRYIEDTTPPKVVIKSPVAGSIVNTPTIVVSGTASDNVAVASVEYRLQNAAGTNSWQLATETTAWSATVSNLIAGPNTVTVAAFDTSSNMSALVSRVFNYEISAPLTLSTNGRGTIIGATSGQLLHLGVGYKITAKPAAGYVFTGWTGSVSTNSPTLKFIMESNLFYTANFIPNPFPLAAGTYEGLFHDPAGAVPAGSGFFSAQVNNNGAFTAKLQQGNAARAISGQFSYAGEWAGAGIKTWGNTAVSLTLDLTGGNMLSGNLVNAAWSSQIRSDRAIYSQRMPAPEAGKYTLVLPAGNSSGLPGGNGYGALSVSPAGQISFIGVLGDGTKVSQSANLSPLAQWPLYVALSGGNGMLIGWLTFANQPSSDLTGTLQWLKPSTPVTAAYPSGFTNQIEAAGSAYLLKSGQPVLNLTDGYVLLENGGLPQSISNQFTLAANNIATGTDKLKLTFTGASGLFQGTTTNSAGKTVSFGGAVLQKQTNGFGLFQNGNQTGSVYLAPR